MALPAVETAIVGLERRNSPARADVFGGPDRPRRVAYVLASGGGARDALMSPLAAANYLVKSFEPEAFYDIGGLLAPACIVLDVRTPVVAASAIGALARARRPSLPVVGVGALAGDLERVVELMKAGVTDILETPFTAERLLNVVAEASDRLAAAVIRHLSVLQAAVRIGEMNPRERDVLGGLVVGGTNKTIARDLGISPRTVEIHRARLMSRLGARNPSEAVSLALAAGMETRLPRPVSH
jgi:FixJ family two-component response regulator